MSTLAPLCPGDIALRFIAHRYRTGAKVERLQAVQILAVDGYLVTWTDGRKNRTGNQLYRRTSDRREFIPISALENLSDETPSCAPLTAMDAGESSTL